MLDEAAVGGEPDRSEQFLLSTGDEDVRRDQGLPGCGMQPRTKHHRCR